MPEKAFRHFLISAAHVAEVVLVIGSRFEAVFVGVGFLFFGEFECVIPVDNVLFLRYADSLKGRYERVFAADGKCGHVDRWLAELKVAAGQRR